MKKAHHMVLCAASAYEEKYYLNPRFQALPESVKKELQTISVLFVEEVGGIFMMEFDDEGQLHLTTQAKDTDYDYDEIGAGLMVREVQKYRAQLMEELQLFYDMVILGRG